MERISTRIVIVLMAITVSWAYPGIPCSSDSQCIVVGQKCVQETPGVKKCALCDCLKGEQCEITGKGKNYDMTCNCGPDTVQPKCEPTCSHSPPPCGMNTNCFDNSGASAATCTCLAGYVGNATEGCTLISCNGGEFRCSNSICVPPTDVCDGDDDCGDNSDEPASCSCASSSCRVDEFTCTNGVCVPYDLLCDSNDDCGDSSDENNMMCASVSFVCPSGAMCADGVCIGTLLLFCDGVSHCADNSDETSWLCAARPYLSYLSYFGLV